MTTNNAILDRIMWANKDTFQPEVPQTSDENAPTTDQIKKEPPAIEDNLVSSIRVVSARYKVYCGIILIFWLIFFTSYFPSIKSKYESANKRIQEIQTTISALTQKEVEYWAQNSKLQEIQTNTDHLQKCLNNSNISECQALPDWMSNYTRLNEQFSNLQKEEKNRILTDDETRKKENLNSCLTLKNFDSCNLLSVWMRWARIPTSFLLFHSLFSEKMPVNERKVLKNINEYLIRDWVSEWSRTINWTIASIIIWDPKLVWDNPHFFQVPIDFTITFWTLPELIAFVHNVEKKLINIPEDRILYKIQEIWYDIIAANEEQTTDISMIAYYYLDN